MKKAFTAPINTAALNTAKTRVFSGTNTEDFEALFVSLKDTCDQAKRVASFTGEEKDGFGLFELTAHLHGIDYVRRFHLASGGVAIIPSRHLKNLSLTLIEWTGGKWRIEANLLPKESCSAVPPPLYLYTEDAPGTHRVPHGADRIIPEVSDPDFAWRTPGAAAAKTPGLLPIPMSAGVPNDVVTGLYSTTTSFRAIWRIQP